MLGRTRRIHFVGIGGIGMSGIAELLANLGYEVSGSDARRSTVTDRLERLGVRVSVGHDAAHVGRADVVVVTSAIKSGNPETIEAVRTPDSGHPAGGDARRAHAVALRHRHRGRPRQDLDDVDGGPGARASRARSDGGHRRTAERVWQQRPARARRLHGGGGRRERPLVPEAVAGDRRHHQHRSRAHGKLRELGRPPAGLRRIREQGAVLRRCDRVRRR